MRTATFPCLSIINVVGIAFGMRDPLKPTNIESSKGIPTAFKKFNSDVLGDLAGIFSGSLVKSGRANGEFTFVIKADADRYKAAVLDALNNYNNYLIAYIKANNN